MDLKNGTCPAWYMSWYTSGMAPPLIQTTSQPLADRNIFRIFRSSLPSETRLLDSGAHLVASLYFIYEAGAYFIILHPVTIQKPMQPLPSFNILQRSYVQLTAGYDIPPCPANLNTLTDNFTKVYGAIRLQKPTRCCALILFSAAASRHQLWRKIIICIILIVAKVGKAMQIKNTHLGMIYNYHLSKW